MLDRVVVAGRIRSISLASDLLAWVSGTKIWPATIDRV